MPTDSQQQHRGRGYGNRGRRGPDRRGGPARNQPQKQQQPPQNRGDQVSVEGLMRDIRSRIGGRDGPGLSEQEAQRLAARCLESILDVRSINPALMEQLRKSVVGDQSAQATQPRLEPPYQFDDKALYNSHRGWMRAIRRLLNPVLKLFLNPDSIVQALQAQSALNLEAARREAKRDRRQAEWNALHYEILQRLVIEVSSVSVEARAVGPLVESLGAKVDFNERRVQNIEGLQHESDFSTLPPPPASSPSVRPAQDRPAAATGSDADSVGPDGTRRRRRRRRGRRSGGPEVIPAESAVLNADPQTPGDPENNADPLAVKPPGISAGDANDGASDLTRIAVGPSSPDSATDTEPVAVPTAATHGETLLVDSPVKALLTETAPPEPIEALIEAPVREPVETAVPAPVNAAAETPVEAPGNVPVKIPTEAPVEKLADAPVEVPAPPVAASPVPSPRPTEPGRDEQ